MSRSAVMTSNSVAVGCLLLLTSVVADGADYDPLAVPAQSKLRTLELTVKDVQRHRAIPVRVYLPQAIQAAPVVLFSHGLGGSREGSGYLGEHWAARGYVAVFLQHPGSDTSVWKDEAPRRRMQAMRQAASAQNFLLRVNDVPALPPGRKYELVLFGAEHSAFTDRALPGDTEPRNPNHHRVILALSTAFWDTYLLGSASAQEWLDGDGPTSVLEEQDMWQKK